MCCQGNWAYLRFTTLLTQQIVFIRKGGNFISNGVVTPLTSPMSGAIAEYHKNVERSILEGETVITIESMKMELPVNSHLRDQLITII